MTLKSKIRDFGLAALTATVLTTGANADTPDTNPGINPIYKNVDDTVDYTVYDTKEKLYNIVNEDLTTESFNKNPIVEEEKSDFSHLTENNDNSSVGFTFKPTYAAISGILANNVNIKKEKLKKISKGLGFDSTDKAQHIIASTAIYAAFRSIGKDIDEAMLETLIVGVIKEVYDKVSGTGNAEFKDFTADGVGLLIGLAVEEFLDQSQFASKLFKSGVKIDLGHYDKTGNFNFGLNISYNF